MSEISAIVAEVQSRHDSIADERARLERLIRRHQKKLDGLPHVGTGEVVHALGTAVAERMGLKVEFYGPFGLGSERSFHLLDDQGATVASMSFRSREGVAPTVVSTDETTRFAPGTVGAVNGFNRRSRPLPGTIDDLVSELRAQIETRAVERARTA